MRLVVARVELDRPLVLLRGAPELVPAMRREQVPIVAQQSRIRRVRHRLLGQRLCREVVPFVAE
jgi:hypothetical protein